MAAKKAAKKNRKPRTKRTIEKNAAPVDLSWQETFLAILAESCNVSNAADGAGIARSTAYKYREIDPEFAARWEDAEERAVDRLEQKAWDRARLQSDTLLIFLLKGRRRAIYGESIEHRVRKLSDEELVAEATGLLGGDRPAGADPS